MAGQEESPYCPDHQPRTLWLVMAICLNHLMLYLTKKKQPSHGNCGRSWLFVFSFRVKDDKQNLIWESQIKG